MLGEPLNEVVSVKGWVKTRRGNKHLAFISLNDGSSLESIQLVADLEQIDPESIKFVTSGACVAAVGKLVASGGKGQQFEIQLSSLEVLGEANPEKYPLQAKKHSLEFLREIAHLRPRTNTFGAVFRIRHHLSFAVHRFFHERGFYQLHTPIITASDAEGAGEMFRVSTLPLTNPPTNEAGNIDFSKDFFGKETHLTVSGQLEAEVGALALGQVYTFGPTFRAENSNTSRHLAEFWMIEPEIAFCDLEQDMDLAEEFVKYLIDYVIQNCPKDLAFLDKRAEQENLAKPKNERNPMGLLAQLHFVLDNDFCRLSYTEAIDILLNSKPNKKKKFKFPVAWGIDLQSEHERYLVEKHFKTPVMLTDYPKDIKAFYMKANDDGKTVRAMDVLFPGIGEIIGGSQREEDEEKLRQRIAEVGIPHEEMWWYLELRKFGSAPHSGFGMGFERMLQFITGMGNIRDVIPFPRTPQNANF